MAKTKQKKHQVIRKKMNYAAQTHKLIAENNARRIPPLDIAIIIQPRIYVILTLMFANTRAPNAEWKIKMKRKAKFVVGYSAARLPLRE